MCRWKCSLVIQTYREAEQGRQDLTLPQVTGSTEAQSCRGVTAVPSDSWSRK